LGIGEAFITMLNEKGIPTPLVHVLLASPRSRMDVLSDTEIDALVAKSKLGKKYAETADSQSAYEILTAKLEEAAAKGEEAKTAKTTGKQPKSVVEEVLDNSVTRQIGRTAASVITRSLLGALGLGGRRSTKKTWF
jgi:hypothetical protein